MKVLSTFKQASHAWWAKKPNVPIHEEWHLDLTLTDSGDRPIHRSPLPLPSYGEVRIITHGGKVAFIETTMKEKVE